SGPPSADVGVPANIEVFVRDSTAGLKVIDIDAGREMKLEPCPEGQKFKDTVPGAWYKIYAVVPPGQSYQGPSPLSPAPPITEFNARRNAEGSALHWKSDVADWVGCDVQWFRIFRGEADRAPTLLKEIYGRTVDGPGGLVESFLDTTATAGKSYAYQIQAV